MGNKFKYRYHKRGWLERNAECLAVVALVAWHAIIFAILITGVNK